MIKAANASRHAGRGGADDDDEDDDGPPTRSSVDEVEMGLLAHDEHASSPTLRFASVDCEGYVESEEGDDVGGRDGYGYGYGYASGEAEATAAAATTTTKVPLTREDKKAMALLIILCASLSSLAFHPTSHLRLPSCPVVADPPPPPPNAKCCVVHSRAHLFLLLDIIQGVPVSSFLPHIQPGRRVSARTGMAVARSSFCLPWLTLLRFTTPSSD